jgi:hypothetical protein
MKTIRDDPFLLPFSSLYFFRLAKTPTTCMGKREREREREMVLTERETPKDSGIRNGRMKREKERGENL